MQQYRIEFFENRVSSTPASRKLVYVHHDFANDIEIDDDYIAMQTTTIEIKSTTKVKAGHFIRILRDEKDYFFGFVTDASPGEYTTRIQFKPFLAVFDSDVLFNILSQWRSTTYPGVSLEEALKIYIDGYFVDNSDYRQNLPMNVTIPESGLTERWNMGIKSDTEGSVWAVVGLYKVLIVRAMKEYGVAIRVTPNFSTGQIGLTIGTVSGLIKIDADLENVVIKTLKVNDRPNSINKLIVHNTYDYTMSKTYYVHSNRTWDDENTNRIVPVSYEIRTVTPDGTYSDPQDDFEFAAISAAYDVLSGLEFDNLIELEVAPNDPIVKPASMKVGQKVSVYHNEDVYTSILTGKSISLEVITLMFGSERIKYTKKTSK